MSRPVNPVLVDLLVHFGQGITKASSQAKELRPLDKMSGRPFVGAAIAAPMPREDWFVLTVCSSGIARALSVVTRKELVTVNSVKQLWFHYPSAGSFLTELFTKVCGLIMTDEDRSNATSFLNLLGRQALSYFEGAPYEDPPRHLVRSIDQFLGGLIDMEARNVTFSASSLDVGCENRTGTTDLIFLINEDEDLYIDEDPVGISYVPKERGTYNYEDIKHLVERKPGVIPASTNSEPQPTIKAEKTSPPRPKDRADTFLEDIKEELLEVEKLKPYGGMEAVVEQIRKILSDQTFQGLVFYKVLGQIAEVLALYIKQEKFIPVTSAVPKEKAVLIVLLWGKNVLPEGNREQYMANFHSTIKTVGPKPIVSRLPIVEPNIASPIIGKQKEAVIKQPLSKVCFKLSRPILSIQLDGITRAPNPFRGPGSVSQFEKLKDTTPTRGWKLPQRRTLMEFRTRQINARVNQRTATFSRSGLSKAQRNQNRDGPRFFQVPELDPGFVYDELGYPVEFDDPVMGRGSPPPL